MSAIQPAEASRVRILRAAAEIAAESGYEATTISKVTKRSGLPVSSVYWFFRDKDQLIAEVVRHSFDEWLARQPPWETVGTEDRRPLGEQLRAILARSVRSLPDAPDFLRIGHLLVLESRVVEPAAREIFLEVRDGVEASIADWFRARLDAEFVSRREELPRDLARIVIAATDGLFLSHQMAEDWDPDDFVTLVVAVVEAAVAA
jgi:AcrR family transcriptional regulator